MTMSQSVGNCYRSAHNNLRCSWGMLALKRVLVERYQRSSDAQNDQLGGLILATDNASVGLPLVIIYARF